MSRAERNGSALLIRDAAVPIREDPVARDFNASDRSSQLLDIIGVQNARKDGGRVRLRIVAGRKRAAQVEARRQSFAFDLFFRSFDHAICCTVEHRSNVALTTSFDDFNILLYRLPVITTSTSLFIAFLNEVIGLIGNSCKK